MAGSAPVDVLDQDDQRLHAGQERHGSPDGPGDVGGRGGFARDAHDTGQDAGDAGSIRVGSHQVVHLGLHRDRIVDLIHQGRCTTICQAEDVMPSP